MAAYRPGDIVGPVEVVELIDDAPVRLENWTYLIRWLCCGREEIQKHKAVRKRELPPIPLSCVKCGRARSMLSRPSEPRKRVHVREEAPVIVAAAGWYWPSLTPNGPRPKETWADTYYESD